jgi:hypothetical protein
MEHAMIVLLPWMSLQLQAQHEVEMEANRGILLHADLQPVDMVGVHEKHDTPLKCTFFYPPVVT